MSVKPGIYESMPFAEYLAIDAISNTYMGQLKRSPRHAKLCRLDDKQKHFVIGELVHCGRLEPMALMERYVVQPPYHLDPENKTRDGHQSLSKSTVFVKEKEAEFQANNPDKTIIDKAWFDEAKGVVESLYQNSESNDLFNEMGAFEITLVWNDPETGLLCKGRMDKIGNSRFGDLKTCMSLDSFPRSIANYGYYRQMGHYQYGYEILTGEILEPWISAVEKTQPYCVQTAPMCEEAVNAGRKEAKRLLRLHVECMESGNWPGPPSPTKWRIPEWAFDDGEEIELILNDQKVSF